MRISNIEVFGMKGAFRGMRQPLNSHDKADTKWAGDMPQGNDLGPNDARLAWKLAGEGQPNRKFLRMIHVQMDITAMQPWWSEFDTYKVGTVRNSGSKMHRIHVKPFTRDDFTTIGLNEVDYAWNRLMDVIDTCNKLREDFNTTHDKKYWRALIELLPEGYNLTATVDLNYETLRQMYYWRKNHKLIEWHTFCNAIEALPLSYLITDTAYPEGK